MVDTVACKQNTKLAIPDPKPSSTHCSCIMNERKTSRRFRNCIGIVKRIQYCAYTNWRYLVSKYFVFIVFLNLMSAS